MQTVQQYILLDKDLYQKLETDINTILNTISNSSTNSEKLCYTEEEVAELFGVTKKTLAKYRNEGKLGFVKPDNGRVILYMKEHINEFLERYEYKAFK